MSRGKPTVGKPKKGSPYYRSPEWRKREYAALSDECRAALHDVSVPNRQIVQMFDVDFWKIHILRRYFVPERVLYKSKWTPEEVALLRSDLSTAEIAERIGITCHQVRRERTKVVGRRRVKSVRYDTSTFALLKSTLPTESVAAALQLSAATVANHRREIRGARSWVRRTWTDDEYREMMAMSFKDGMAYYGLSWGSMRNERMKAMQRLGIETNKMRTNRLPRDPAAYAGKTSAELVAEYGLPRDTIIHFCRRNGYEYKKLR